jgi:hypothetical protein
MATLAMGSGNTGYNGKGVAWQGSITSASFENLMPEPASYYRNNNITVQNHSYGTGIENEYAADAAAYDKTMWDAPGLLHVFSAGNRGNETPDNGPFAGIPGFSNLSGSFKMSKNSISVGATDSFYTVEAMSSRGPAFDGRIKPELTAFGSDGSSGSAALVSGAALLTQQMLKEKTGTMPHASLVKAILIGSAGRQPNKGPDYKSGYGHLDVYQALQLIKDSCFFTGNASSTGLQDFFLEVPSSKSTLKITLCWTDTPGTVLQAKALINDLDLLVSDPSGQNWYPWTLSTFAHKDSLNQPAIRGTDHLNVVEQVDIPNPAPGIYRIRVSPFLVSGTSQPFSIAYRLIASDTFQFDYPTSNTPVASSGQSVIRWKQSFPELSSGTLEYKFINQSTWQTISAITELSKNLLTWTPPDTTALMMLRMNTGNKFFYSDSFLVYQNLSVRTGYVCSDSALVSWKKHPGNLQYRVYSLSDTLMKLEGTTSDTLFKLPLEKLLNNWVTVSVFAQENNNIEARQPSFNIFEQGVECYFKSFLAQWDNNTSILDVSLGSTYDIQKLYFKKQSHGKTTVLDSIQPVFNVTYKAIDNNLQAGNNTYWVQLVLKNGNIIESEVQTIIQTEQKGWWVYPNPVKRSQPLFITSRIGETEDIYVDIYDVHGRKTGNRIIPFIDNSIPVSNLNAGVYFLVFTNGKQRIGQQKIVVLP